MATQDELFETGKIRAVIKRKIKKTNTVSVKSLDPSEFAPITGALDDVLSLARYASTRYLQYAIATVKDRALPRIADGQKPVQARIMYAMWEMSALSVNPRKKSARVVGDVLGKFHPHGDASVYDAMVRMSQEFTLRYPLIDGEGNFGSRDGDDAAAMRYTEARLTSFAGILLSELNQGTVNFAPNYDGSILEPNVLPARLPVLLLNGASGIAVGMATDVPSHNIVEVGKALISLIKKPSRTVRQLVATIKGPDFPGGGQIITSTQDILQVYETGRGSIRVRASWRVEKLSRGQWQIVVHELPPGTSARRVLEEIEAITSPQLKPGRKALTIDQQKEKQLMLSMLDRVRDESDRNNPIRLVFEPKSSRIKDSDFINLLLSKTTLETNVSINLVTIGLDGKPKNKNLKEILLEWLDFRFTTVERRTRHNLDKVNGRIHLLEGRLIVLLNVDDVIKVIRESENPKKDLMDIFKLTAIQAGDILEIRLRQLAKLEHIKLEKELKGLRQNKRSLSKILKDRSVLEKSVADEIAGDVSVFGDKRRTLVEVADRAVIEVPVIDEPVTVIFSSKGWIKCRQGWEVDRNSLTFKEGDSLAAFLKLKTTNTVVFLDSKGRTYCLGIEQLPSGRGDGLPVSSLVDVQDGAHISFCVSGSEQTKFLICSDAGYGFLSTLSDMVTNRRSGREFMSLGLGEKMLAPVKVEQGASNYVATVSSKSRLLIFSINELKTMAKGRGNILMGLHEGETLVASAVISNLALKISGVGIRSKKNKEIFFKGDKLSHFLGRRARMGRTLPQKLKSVIKLVEN